MESAKWTSAFKTGTYRHPICNHTPFQLAMYCCERYGPSQPIQCRERDYSSRSSLCPSRRSRDAYVVYDWLVWLVGSAAVHHQLKPSVTSLSTIPLFSFLPLSLPPTHCIYLFIYLLMPGRPYYGESYKGWAVEHSIVSKK